MPMFISFSRLPANISVQHYADILRLLTALYGKLETVPTKEQVEQTAATHFVAIAKGDVRGDIVGMATLVLNRQFAKVMAVAEDVVVMPEFRGRGVGKGLMQMIECAASNGGAKTVDLVTDLKRRAACALYEKNGYVTRDKVNYRKTI